MNKPLSPTEQLIVDTTVECEKLRFALHGCLTAARECKRELDVYSDAKGTALSHLNYIENEAHMALYGGKGNE